MAKKFAIPFAATGDKAVVPDALQPDGSVSYTQGFGPDYELDRDVDPVNAKDVPRDETNQLFFDVTDAVGEIQKNGAALWSLDMAPYPINARVYHSDRFWRSNIINNNGEPGVDASWDDVSSIPIAGQNIAVFATAGATNWSVPAALQSGALKARVRVTGGGASGARRSLQSGGGGGAGGTAIGEVDLSGVSSVTITVGAGGSSPASDSAGSPGGTSSFGSYMSAGGGLPIGGSSFGGSNGGVGVGGSINIRGGGGGAAKQGIGGSSYVGGMGGCSIYGGGGAESHSSAIQTGTSGVNGGGGSGGILNGVAGAGGDGVVIIEW
jgi:hypothetical protein